MRCERKQAKGERDQPKNIAMKTETKKKQKMLKKNLLIKSLWVADKMVV